MAKWGRWLWHRVLVYEGLCSTAPGCPRCLQSSLCSIPQFLPAWWRGGISFWSQQQFYSWVCSRTHEQGEHLSSSMYYFCPLLSQSVFQRKGKTQRPNYRTGKKAISFVAFSAECGSSKEWICSTVLTVPRASYCKQVPVWEYSCYIVPCGYLPAPAWWIPISRPLCLLSHLKDCSKISLLR